MLDMIKDLYRFIFLFLCALGIILFFATILSLVLFILGQVPSKAVLVILVLLCIVLSGAATTCKQYNDLDKPKG